ncbi:MAG: type II toxin-antitoxin system PrlF family antitoxin [Chloroflexi bacterium]|nr:type II toxin-antitoxin system PrlF family antitoxin [Chloroflexota bacterium]
MKEVISTVTSKGQVTIPAEIRRHLGVATNDKLSFIIEDDGTVRVSVPRYPTIESLRGAAGKLDRSLSWEEMREIAREDHLTKYERNRP